MPEESANYLIRIKELENENLLLKNKLEFQELYNEFSTTWEMFRNQAGRFIYISPSFERITGYGRAELLEGKIDLNELVHDDDKNIVSRSISKDSGSQPVSDFVFRIICKKNCVKFLSVSSQPVYNHDNEFLGTRISFVDITRFKEIEEALRDSQIKLKTVFDNSIHGIILVNAEGIVVDWNRCLENISGISKENVINEYIWKAQYWLSAGETKERCTEKKLEQLWRKKIFLLQNNELYTATGMILNANGGIEITEDFINPVTIGNKKFYCAFQRYVTKQKTAEQALKESEEKYLKAFLTSPYAIILTRVEDRKIIDVNDAFAVTTGHLREDTILRSTLELNLWVDDKSIREYLSSILSNVDLSAKEVLFRRKDGEIRIGLLSSSLIHTNGRQLILASLKDITDRKQAEIALSIQNTFFSKLNSFAVGLSDLSFVDNLESFITRQIRKIACAELATFAEYDPANKTITTKELELESGMMNQVVKLLGRRVQTVQTFVSDEMRTEMTSNVIRVFDTLTGVSFGAISPAVGAAIQTLLRIDRFIALVYLTEGKIYGTTLLGMAKDQVDPPMEILKNFTLLAAESLQRKRAEVKLTRKVEELAIVNEKLEKYTFTNQELKQLAYTASHQLQEPIRTVKNYTQIIEEDYSEVLNKQGLGYLQTIRDATQKMSVLINSLNEYARLGRNKRLIYADTKNLIDQVIESQEYLITSSRAVIEVSDMPMLYVYELEFLQLIQNLITNALKFQKKSTRPRIKICSAMLNGIWRFSVADNGIGIHPEHFKRIFDIFQRLHSTEDEYEGMGIGLAYCKKIVQLHQGDIWVESKPGKGTTFYFTVSNLKKE